MSVTCILIHKFIEDAYPHWVMTLQTMDDKADVNSLHVKRSYHEIKANPRSRESPSTKYLKRLKLQHGLINIF